MTLKIWLLAGAILLAAFGAWKWQQAALEREKGLRVAAEQSAALAKDTTRIIERTMTHENTIYRQAEESADEVQAQPGADAPVPDELLSSWGRAVIGLRSQAAATDDQRP
jgi:hypothetical protein